MLQLFRKTNNPPAPCPQGLRSSIESVSQKGAKAFKLEKKRGEGSRVYARIWYVSLAILCTR